MKEKSFGQIIREQRMKLGMSQKQLASKIKKEDGESISAQYQNDIEHNRRNPPSEFLIEQYAKHLDLPVDYLMVAAGSVPSDIRERAIKDPKVAEAIQETFKAFRRSQR
jgi:transcriptional regulator with XRE-family HTH domain